MRSTSQLSDRQFESNDVEKGHHGKEDLRHKSEKRLLGLPEPGGQNRRGGAGAFSTPAGDEPAGVPDDRLIDGVCAMEVTDGVDGSVAGRDINLISSGSLQQPAVEMLGLGGRWSSGCEPSSALWDGGEGGDDVEAACAEEHAVIVVP